MSLLLETIRIEARRIINAQYHNDRLNRTRHELYGMSPAIDVLELVSIPAGLGMGIYRCRILYDEKIREIQFLPHKPRVVSSLKIVEENRIDYSHKYADRSRLEELFSMKGDCDDVLIVKNGCITDTSSANIIFRTPAGDWHTPDTPLLEGTMRRHLLDKGIISERRLTPAELCNYDQARLINCLMDHETGHRIAIGNIRF